MKRQGFACVISFLLLLLTGTADGESLRAHVNVPHYAAGYFRDYPERIAFDDLVTDLSVILGPDVKDPAATYRDALLSTRQANATGKLVIGTYLSSRRVLPKAEQYPENCIELRYFSKNEFMPEPYRPQGEAGEFVDIRQPAARWKIITLLVNRAVARNATVLYSDNWSHPSTGGTDIPWTVTVEFMADLRAALKAKGIKLYVNLALAIGADVPAVDIEKLAGSCDGVSLEMALVPTVAEDPVALARAVTQYQALIAKKVVVVMIPLGDDAESRFLAGLAMVLDGPLVAHPFWKPNPDWHLWRDQFGRPKDKSKQDGTVLSRKFERGTIVVDCAARTVEARY